MVTIYSYTTGFVDTEQDLVTAIDDFLTSDIGDWSRLVTVEDGVLDRDYIWRSYGTVSGTYRPIDIRMRGYNNYLYFYGYLTFSGTDPSNPADYEEELYDSTYTRIPTSASPFRYWLIGNADFVQVHIQQAEYYMGYAGLIRSYYLPETDDYPLLIRGQSSSSTSWDTSNYSLYMHDTVSSGEAAYHAYADNWSDTYWLKYDTGLRTEKMLALPPVIFCKQVGKYEVRGEPYGMYKVSNTYSPHQASVLTTSGTYLAFKINTDAFVFGPVSSGTCSVF